MFKVAAVFSSNMVLQREKNVSIFGTADNGEKITVSIPELSVSVKAVVNDGRWQAILPPMQAMDAITVKVSSENGEKIFENVAVGEVWLCGGQSNMELEVHSAKDGEELLKSLTPECGVRFYYTQKQGVINDNFYKVEENTCWYEASPENSRAWSAVGLHFAMKLAKELGVTIGLIGCNWGGTSASAWMNEETLLEDKDTATYISDYKEKLGDKTEEQLTKEYEEYLEYDKQWFEKSQAYYKEHPNASWDEVQEACGKNMWPGPMCSQNPFRPCGLFETMLMRVCPYTLRGFTYYQGESDDHKPTIYHKMLTKLISLWREKWGDDELAFLIVQLPMFKYANDPDYKHWVKVREAQMRVFKTVKNTGIAVISDCGEFDNIHPTDKKPVGLRLALQALKLCYGKDVDAFGPMYASHIYKDGGIELCFDYAKDGFDVKGELCGFEIAGEDKQFTAADAKICGDRIFISSDKVKEPLYARYDCFNWCDVSVYGKNGIPLAPFRTSRNDE